MALFEDVERLDLGPARAAEGHYAYLERSARPEAARVRAAIEAWFARYPEAARADLAGRIRSGSDRPFLAAWWELYLHELLTRAGMRVSAHPKLPGVATRPDFEVAGGGDGFYVEAKVVFDTDAESAGARHEAQALDTLDQVRNPDFLLCVRVLARGDRSPGVRAHIGRITTWLAGLDPDDVRRRLVEQELAEQRWPSDDDPDPDLRYDIEQEGWHLLIEPSPVAAEYRGTPERAVGSVFPFDSGEAIDDVSPLRKALARKAPRYGRLDRPFVLAVLLDAPFADVRDVEAALFGTMALRYTERRSSADPTEAYWERQPDGLLRGMGGPRRAKVSAVLVGAHLGPWSAASPRSGPPALWHHPWAERPLVLGLPLASVRLNERTRALVRSPALLAPHELVGLWHGWPAEDEAHGSDDDEVAP